MDVKIRKNVEKWQDEIKSLEKARRKLKKYQKLKNDKAQLDDIHKAGDKVEDVISENGWMKLNWKEIKRSRDNIEKGLEKIEDKIAVREKEEAAEKAAAEDERIQGKNDSGKPSGTDSRQENKAEGKSAETGAVTAKAGDASSENGWDWSVEIDKCALNSIYYHWAFGEMEVAGMDEDGKHIYLRLLDRNGCRPEWDSRNEVAVEVNGRTENLKEFLKSSIGRWLFPNKEDVLVKDPETAHRMFADDKL